MVTPGAASGDTASSWLEHKFWRLAVILELVVTAEQVLPHPIKSPSEKGGKETLGTFCCYFTAVMFILWREEVWMKVSLCGKMLAEAFRMAS